MAKPSTSSWVVRQVLADPVFNDPEAIPHLWVKGKTPVYLVLGENAAGKSIFRRFVQGTARQSTIKETISLNMEGRTGGGFRRLAYGSEVNRATGMNSARTVTMGIKTARERGHFHLLYWDEPDIGMSDGLALGCARKIAEFCNDLPKNTRGVFITTHNRSFVQTLLQGITKDLNYIFLGDDPPPNLRAWLDAEVTEIDPDELFKAERRRFEAILKHLEKGDRDAHPRR